MTLDAVVVGSGPNGLSAAITLAAAGRSVVVVEAHERPGGGMRSGQVTLPGFVHDICSAVHPLAVASPFFRDLPLDEYGLEWIHPDIPVAHPIAADHAVAVYRSIEATAQQFGGDWQAYQDWLLPFVQQSDALLTDVLAPLHVPQHPWLMARFGRWGIRSAERMMSRFRDAGLRGMFAGMAGHSVQPMSHALTAAVGMMFCVTAHSRGWPIPRGGSEQIAIAMTRHLEKLAGTVLLGRHVRSLADIPDAKTVFFDVSPRQLAEIAAGHLPDRYRKKLNRFRHGPGSFKLDWALSGPIPWTAEACRRAGTVHVGGTFQEIAEAEQCVAAGTTARQPFVLVAQQSLFDTTRAPPGKHAAWAYCHVPHGCTENMTERIEAQLERFAPGFQDLILDRYAMGPHDLESYNSNYIGGDITGGVMDLWQTFARPVSWWSPYRTPNERIFICSASTPPGGGVHGMCGWHAAQAALRTVLR